MAMFDYPILSHCQGQFQQENINGAKKYFLKKKKTYIPSRRGKKWLYVYIWVNTNLN